MYMDLYEAGELILYRFKLLHFFSKLHIFSVFGVFLQSRYIFH